MSGWKIIRCDKKTSVLKKFTFGCMKDLYALNITSGCIHDCVYCYAKSYSNRPPSSSIYIYKNIGAMLEKELDSLRRKLKPVYVIFNTASDSFQPADEVLDIAYRAMRILIERDIPFSFLTKGIIPCDFVELFRLKPHLVHARIGITSLSEYYHDVFEPNTAKPHERLQNIDMLRDAGVDVEVRVDPIVPSITDNYSEIKRLISSLKEHGVSEISISYLHIRPYILSEMGKRLGKKEFGRIVSYFLNEPWQEVCTSRKTKLVPYGIRKRTYTFINWICSLSGIKAHVCVCKNPDFDGEPCSGVQRKSLMLRIQKQPSLPEFFNTNLFAKH